MGAGAHIDILLDDDTVRQYSLCGDPARRDALTVAVLREPAGRGGSARVHDELVDGVRTRLRGPRNHFPLAAAPRYTFIAGGIGITPIMAMLRSVAATAPTRGTCSTAAACRPAWRSPTSSPPSSAIA